MTAEIAKHWELTSAVRAWIPSTISVLQFDVPTQSGVRSETHVALDADEALRRQPLDFGIVTDQLFRMRRMNVRSEIVGVREASSTSLTEMSCVRVVQVALVQVQRLGTAKRLATLVAHVAQNSEMAASNVISEARLLWRDERTVLAHVAFRQLQCAKISAKCGICLLTAIMQV